MELHHAVLHALQHVLAGLLLRNHLLLRLLHLLLRLLHRLLALRLRLVHLLLRLLHGRLLLLHVLHAALAVVDHLAHGHRLAAEATQVRDQTLVRRVAVQLLEVAHLLQVVRHLREVVQRVHVLERARHHHEVREVARRVHQRLRARRLRLHHLLLRNDHLAHLLRVLHQVVLHVAELRILVHRLQRVARRRLDHLAHARARGRHRLVHHVRQRTVTGRQHAASRVHALARRHQEHLHVVRHREHRIARHLVQELLQTQTTTLHEVLVESVARLLLGNGRNHATGEGARQAVEQPLEVRIAAVHRQLRLGVVLHRRLHRDGVLRVLVQHRSHRVRLRNHDLKRLVSVGESQILRVRAVRSQVEVCQLEVRVRNRLDRRLALLLSARNQLARNHPSVARQRGLVLAVSSELPDLAQNVVVQSRSAQELSALLSVDLPITTNPQTHLVVLVVVHQVEELVVEGHLLSGDVNGLLLHGHIDATLINVQLAQEV